MGRCACGFAPATRGRERPRVYVRVNALDSGLTDADLDVVMQGAPDGIVQPKPSGGADLQHISNKIAVREAQNDLPDGSTRVIVITTETAASLFHMGTYAGASRRLAGLTWGAEDLSADLGAEISRLPDGTYTPPYVLARNLALFAAHAARVQAIDTVYPNFRDEAGFRRECEAARRDGFAGKMAIHPAQVPIINEVFTPPEAEVARARAVALVADLVIIIALAAERLLDGALDIVLRHVFGARGDDGSAEPRIHRRIGQTHLGGDGDFARQFGEELGADRILLALLVHDVLELTVASHRNPLK